MARQPDRETVARDNAQLNASLRRLRRHLEQALQRAESASAAARTLRPAGREANELAARLERDAAELRRALEQAGGAKAASPNAEDGRGPDGRAESEERERMTPPISEVMDTLRGRR